METPLLLIRHFQADDVDTLASLFGNPNVAYWMGDGETLSREQCALWIAKSQHNYHHYGYGVFAVVLKDTGKMIGCGGLVHPDEASNCEVIYALEEALWKQGYGTEMVPHILKDGFERCGMTSIYATVDPENSGSVRLLTGVGMQYVNTLPDENGQPTATYLLQRLSDTA